METGDIYQGPLDTFEIIEAGPWGGFTIVKSLSNGFREMMPQSLVFYYIHSGNWIKRNSKVPKIKIGHPLTKIFV